MGKLTVVICKSQANRGEDNQIEEYDRAMTTCISDQLLLTNYISL